MKFDRSKTLWVSHPHPRYPTISITGDHCDLNCAHCEGRYLEGMISVKNQGELYEACTRLASNGSRGVLLSGGYNSEGYVPFESFVNSIRKVKEETNLFISIHSGLMPPALVSQLATAGVDAVDFDLIGDDETIRLILGIQKTPEDYIQTLENLANMIPHVAPHICLGLHEGEFRGEWRALKLAGKVDISALVFLILNPTLGTPFEKVIPPAPNEVGGFIAEARVKFPDIPLALGCMRPHGEKRSKYEIQALRAGVDRIELPTLETLEAARELGLEPRRLEACCAVPEEMLEG
ncbi:hypothetical protein AKJ35_00945 [candidate division MSBL1 archaeon SCGC-AAA833F18]|uniref:Radical SAM core domain-containing protein n=1 Tax=candidate division MSBL1 archaeon SCGC-AAA833F18 TaxID=1698257 RepID=A0A133VSD6_9EURY|nr:hypothetical protein AKJ35_00945 [candidate division MSBL1 archaeon SCGC-AAA833F18]